MENMQKFERVIVTGDPFWVDEIYKDYYKAYYLSKDLDNDTGYTTLVVQHKSCGQHNQKESISKLSNFRINQGKIKVQSITSFLVENFVKGDTADIFIKAGNKEFGHSTIWLSGEADTIPWRTQNYQSRFTKEEILDEDFNEKGLEHSKSYIADSDSPIDAIYEVFNFWCTKSDKEERLSIASTKEEAIQILKETSDDFVIVFLK